MGTDEILLSVAFCQIRSKTLFSLKLLLIININDAKVQTTSETYVLS